MASLPSPLIEQREQGTIVHYDILGLTYWMLSRLEEVGRTDLDNHQRFPATSSHAYQHGYLERPIVDEWLHILGQVIRQVWPQLELKQHHFSMKVSHDVDAPSRYGFCSAKVMVRSMAVDVLKRRDVKSALAAPWIRLNTRQRLHSADAFNTFDWIMEQSERNGLSSAFYFICGRTDPAKDADYEPEHPVIRELIRRIHARGHEVGLHPSYNTFQQADRIVSEAKRLRSVMAEVGVEQCILGGRMHFLRWEQPTTLQGWEQAGMSYDSTLSYADLPGFRCGTCFEYPAFNPVIQQQYKVRIRPLIAMECTVMADRYMGLGTGDAAYAKFKQLKDACRAVKGCFTLLWHNSQFESVRESALYQRILTEK
ncbi:polysaccharide deacetylase family protein [Oceanimonas sp. NS1]|nr:polysaccharide deacetylase family protein [Oceanimonas sp. NS1]